MFTKEFHLDIVKIYNKLKNKTPFAFSKYADGEYAILRNQHIRNCDNWVFNPEIHQKQQQELMDSFTYSDDGYYVGISCPCCVPMKHVEWMRNTVKVKDENLTWANIFVNGNFQAYQELFIPEYSNHEIILFANENANVSNLPFEVEEHVKVSDTAWFDNFHLTTDFPVEDYSGKLFLFCAGPLGNMLSAKFWKRNKNNIYIDIGSTLNGYLVGKNRGYLRGAPTLTKICEW